MLRIKTKSHFCLLSESSGEEWNKGREMGFFCGDGRFGASIWLYFLALNCYLWRKSMFFLWRLWIVSKGRKYSFPSEDGFFPVWQRTNLTWKLLQIFLYVVSMIRKKQLFKANGEDFLFNEFFGYKQVLNDISSV